MAYNQVFNIMGIFLLIASALMLLLKSPAPRAADAATLEAEPAREVQIKKNGQVPVFLYLLTAPVPLPSRHRLIPPANPQSETVRQSNCP